MKQTKWVPVFGYEGLYEVSNDGNVRSLNYMKTGRTQNLKLNTDKDGYKTAALSHCGITKTYKVHRLMLLSFIGQNANKPFVNHKNGVKNDNRINNLEWVTAKENVQHSFDKLGREGPKGEDNPQSKLTRDDVISIREQYNNTELTNKEISRNYPVTSETIARVTSNRIWRHV